jgi:hypothetical protein
VGARTDAARAQVLAQRSALLTEVERLEAAGRAAVDIPAKIRRAPARTAGLAAGAAFVVAGGPRRILRGVQRAVRGPAADLPKSMLPAQVDKALRKMGADGDRVRGTLEREFARYLDKNAERRKERDVAATASVVLGNVLKPVSKRMGQQLAEQLFSPDAPGFEAALRKVRGRRSPTDRP